MTNVLTDVWSAPLGSRPQILGRGEIADIRVSSSFRHVSRFHAEFSGEKSQVMLRDLGSRTGTQVNGVWLEPKRKAPLASGDKLWIGGLELCVFDDLPTIAKVLAESGPRLAPNVAIVGDEGSSQSSIHRTPTFQPQSASIARTALGGLTQAELEIVLWICRGYFEDHELGKLLHRSPNTIRTQIGSVFRKLGVGSRAQLMAFVKRHATS